jgi:hypothetical protein
VVCAKLDINTSFKSSERNSNIKGFLSFIVFLDIRVYSTGNTEILVLPDILKIWTIKWSDLKTGTSIGYFSTRFYWIFSMSNQEYRKPVLVRALPVLIPVWLVLLEFDLQNYRIWTLVLVLTSGLFLNPKRGQLTSNWWY